MKGNIALSVLQHWEILARNKEMKSSKTDSNFIFCNKTVSCFSFCSPPFNRSY